MKETRNYLLLTFSSTFIFWGIIALYTQINKIAFNKSVFIMILYVLGVICPAISAIVIKKISSTKENYKLFLKNIISPSKKLIWYLIIIGIILAFKFIPYSIFGGKKIEKIYMIILMLPVYILIGGLEDIGWRGLLLHNLEKKFSAFISTIITGIIWIIWHLPLFFIIGTYQNLYSNYYTFALNTLGFTFILSAIYNNTKSIFMCILCHALLNSVSGVFIVNETLISSLSTLFIGIVIFVVFELNKKLKNK